MFFSVAAKISKLYLLLIGNTLKSSSPIHHPHGSNNNYKDSQNEYRS